MIVCLGWGSLIWNPGSLPIKVDSNPPWVRNGPCLPIEFARKSQDGRITLVITPGAEPIQVFYAVMDVTSVMAARCALAARKGTSCDRIGIWSRSTKSGHDEVAAIGKWAVQLGYKGVVWTALPSNFEEKTGKKLNADNDISYLKCLRNSDRATEAEKYVRLTPAPIRTHTNCIPC